MKLPNPGRAVVEVAKLRDYCLSLEHPRGRHKARVFAARLGFTANDAGKLRAMLLHAVAEYDATPREADDYGRLYELDCVLSGPAGLATVRSLWIVRQGEDFPRLVTCYVL